VSNKIDFKVLNTTVIPDLGVIDYAFFDKTGTLTNQSQTIETVSTKKKLYASQHSFSKKIDLH
jgi:P-type E1-E2 ATPase